MEHRVADRRQLTPRKESILSRQAAKHLPYPGHPQNHLVQMSRVQYGAPELCGNGRVEEKTQGLEESGQVTGSELTGNILQSVCYRSGVPVGSLLVFLTHTHTSARGFEIKAKPFLTELRTLVTSLNLS